MYGALPPGAFPIGEARGFVFGAAPAGHSASLDAWSLSLIRDGIVQVVMEGEATPGNLDCTRVSPNAKHQVCGVALVDPPGELTRSSNVQEYAGSAYGWAMEDTTSFCKLIGDPVTRRLLGAHVIGAQASLLVQPLVQGLHLGTSVDDLATGQVWIHPALAEVNEVALLKLVEAFDA